MSESLRLYTSILFGFEFVVRSMPASAWDDPSPCDSWTRREVAGHAMSVVNNIAARGGVGTAVDGFADVGGFAGPKPYDTFRRCRDRYLLATDREGALQTMIKSRLGEMTLDTYIGKMCIDTLVHTWDVAHGSGVDDTLDPDAVHVIWSQVCGAVSEGTDLVRAPGFFDTELAPAGAGEADLLIAFTGRSTSR
jgi:uncharacterized protein (TIGR03086 family)